MLSIMMADLTMCMKTMIDTGHFFHVHTLT